MAATSSATGTSWIPRTRRSAGISARRAEVRRLLPLLLAGACLAGCSHGRQGLDPDHLPPLPAQFLAVERDGSTVLVRLDGSEIGRLVGYRVDNGLLMRGRRRFNIDRRSRKL